MKNNNQPTTEQKKEKAIELMKQLNIYKPFIDDFKDKNLVCFFENCIGFWVYQEPEIEAKMREIENEYNCMVYAITHEFTNIGELYNFLIVPNYPEEWDELIYAQNGNEYITYAYVWNKSDDWCSEFGTVAVQSFCGGIKRIG